MTHWTAMAGDVVPLPADRRRFLDERREICRQRFDTMHAPVYDDRWGGYVNPTHDACLRRLVAALPAGARVLDAACGTGRGTDQSQAMLDVAIAKHPEVTVHRVALQDLAESRPPEPDDQDELDAPLVTGEVVSGGAYHYYPSVADAVTVLREGGFRVDELLEGDGYAHVLLSA